MGTREASIILDAAGYDFIFIETVGVGQSETAVHSMVDIFVLLMLGGAGDELQGIKRGIMEMADILLINKADGDNLITAKKAQAQYKTALHLLPTKPNGWTPQVGICSALEKQHIDQAWETIEAYRKWTQERGTLQSQRQEQNSYWFHQMIKTRLEDDFYSQNHSQIAQLEKEVIEAKLSPSQALQQLFH